MRNLILNDSSVFDDTITYLIFGRNISKLSKMPSDLFIKSDLKAIYIKNTIFLNSMTK